MLHDEGIEFTENVKRHRDTVQLRVELYANYDILYLDGVTGFKA